MLIKRIEGATRTIGKEQGYHGLPIRDELINCKVNGPETPQMTTAWEPTPDELLRLLCGGSVLLHILGGPNHPPVSIDVGNPPEGSGDTFANVLVKRMAEYCQSSTPTFLALLQEVVVMGISAATITSGRPPGDKVRILEAIADGAKKRFAGP